jgi:hypothetical protein
MWECHAGTPRTRPSPACRSPPTRRHWRNRWHRHHHQQQLPPHRWLHMPQEGERTHKAITDKLPLHSVNPSTQSFARQQRSLSINHPYAPLWPWLPARGLNPLPSTYSEGSSGSWGLAWEMGLSGDMGSGARAPPPDPAPPPTPVPPPSPPLPLGVDANGPLELTPRDLQARMAPHTHATQSSSDPHSPGAARALSVRYTHVERPPPWQPLG